MTRVAMIALVAGLLAGHAQAQSQTATLARIDSATAEMTADGTIIMHMHGTDADGAPFARDVKVSPSEAGYARFRAGLPALTPGTTVPVPPGADPAATPPVVPAPEADYAAFKALAGPYRLVDFVAAGYTAGMSRTDPAQVALRAAYLRNLKADPDGVVDPVMRQAFANFSHDDVERLPQIVARPVYARYRAAIVSALLNGGDVTEAGKTILNDPDYLAWSAADQALMNRFDSTVALDIAAAMPGADKIGKATMAKFRAGRK